MRLKSLIFKKNSFNWIGRIDPWPTWDLVLRCFLLWVDLWRWPDCRTTASRFLQKKIGIRGFPIGHFIQQNASMRRIGSCKKLGRLFTIAGYFIRLCLFTKKTFSCTVEELISLLPVLIGKDLETAAIAFSSSSSISCSSWSSYKTL